LFSNGGQKLIIKLSKKLEKSTVGY